MLQERRPSGTAKKWLVALLVTGAVVGAACAHPPARQDACDLVEASKADALVRMPFELVDGRIYVQARVNGRGPFRFAVDTGASGMARADASLVSLLGLKIQGQASNSDGVRTAQAQTVHVASLELGNLQRENLEAITRDYNARQSRDAAFSGIIAREFFADGLLTIDYPNRVLSFGRAHALSPGGKNVLNYERAFRIPVSIGEVQVEGNLDTGANVAFVLPQSLYATVSAGPVQRTGHGQLANGSVETGRAIVRGPFRIGQAVLSDVEVRISDSYPELLVGAHALQDAVLLIDQRSNSVAVCK